ncbi:hypothetical protein EYF80_002638 [Liparis tanakae]|uniref:Uncharacterized protein n=1 Tax=Liparis tanakae TaxID=230148 RepID=A0A4Z2JAV6_9TELE|nr:hypothetical protein EYF80_002638 [Liparis tanakae]
MFLVFVTGSEGPEFMCRGTGQDSRKLQLCSDVSLIQMSCMNSAVWSPSSTFQADGKICAIKLKEIAACCTDNRNPDLTLFRVTGKRPETYNIPPPQDRSDVLLQGKYVTRTDPLLL